MKSVRRRIANFVLATLLVTSISLVATSQVAVAGGPRGFNDEYIYAVTRAVNDMDAHPAAKITLFPVTIALDTAFLPFAVLAGFIV